MATVEALFPLVYEVHGLYPRYRNRQSALVCEPVPIDFDVIEAVTAHVEIGDIRCPVAAGRLWLPMNDGSGIAIKDADALSAYAEQVGLLGNADVGINPAGFGTLPRPPGMGELGLKRNDDWTAFWRTVDWTDRDEAMDRMHVMADHISFIEGRPYTDRLEPIVYAGEPWNLSSHLKLVDVTTGRPVIASNGFARLQPFCPTAPMTSPGDGPHRGEIKWTADLSVTLAMYLHSHLAGTIDTRVGRRTVLDACGRDVRDAVTLIGRLRDDVMNGRASDFHVTDFDRCLAVLAEARSDNPRHASAAEAIRNAVGRIRDAIAAQRQIAAAPSAADEEAIDQVALLP